MKGTKQTQQTPRSNLASPSSKSHALKMLQPQTSSRQSKGPIKSSGNLDSKASTSDNTHKLDSSQGQLKDISFIEPKSQIQDDPCPENNISGLSIIDFLQESVTLKCLQEAEINDGALKKELEMKNRLVEKLMSENARLREEMETALAKKSVSVASQEDHGQKVADLQRQIGQLESTNKGLKEELEKKSNDQAAKEAQIKKFEDKVEQYMKQSKTGMEDFHKQFEKQLTNFVEKTKRQHDDFSRLVQNQVTVIRNPNAVIPQTQKTGRTRNSVLNNVLNQNENEMIRGKRNAKKKGGNFSIPALNFSGTPSAASTPVKEKTDLSFTGKRQNGGAHTSRHYFDNCDMIDEKPEINGEKGLTTPLKRVSNVGKNMKKLENSENQNPNRKDNMRTSVKDRPSQNNSKNIGSGWRRNNNNNNTSTTSKHNTSKQLGSAVKDNSRLTNNV